VFLSANLIRAIFSLSALKGLEEVYARFETDNAGHCTDLNGSLGRGGKIERALPILDFFLRQQRQELTPKRNTPGT